MDGNTVTFLVGILGALGAYWTYRNSKQRNDFDVFLELKKTNKELQKQQQENIDLRDKVSDLSNIIEQQNKTIMELKSEIASMRSEMKGEQG